MDRCRYFLAGSSKFGAITSSEASVRSAAKRLVNIQDLAIVGDGGPVLAAVGAVDGDADVVATVRLEVRVTPEPPPHLLAEVVSDSLGGLGVDKVLLTGVQGLGLELGHGGVAPRVSGGRVTVEVLEAGGGDAGAEDLINVCLGVDLGQRIRQGSEPGDGGGRDQVLEEHSAFVLIFVSHTSLLLASSLSRTEGDSTDSSKASREENKLLHVYLINIPLL